MSDEVGVATRQALERARAAELAHRRGYHERLERVAELERIDAAAETGDRGTERLVQELWRVAPAEATRLVREARDLCPRASLLGEELPPRLPCTATVAASGEIGPAHIAIIRTTMTRLDRVDDLPPSRWAEAEQTLAARATELGPRGLQAVADQLLAHLDPDGEEPPEEGLGRDDELLVVRRKDGAVVFRGRLSDPVDGEAFVEVIDTLAEPCGPDDEREQSLRRADALKDLVGDARRPRGIAADARDGVDGGEDLADTAEDEVEHAADDEAQVALIPEPRRLPIPGRAPVGTERGGVARPGRALLTITMDHRWLCAALGEGGGGGTLDSGARVAAGTLRRWACDAEVVPLVLGTRSEPLDVGRAARTAPDAIRRALHLRDGGCAFPGCARRPRRCHAHHIHHWFDGGATALDNMVLLCRYHHQLLHRGRWTVAVRDGIPWFTPPDVIDPEQRPRPGGRPRVPL
ncbi:HNH endonuclease signature motif containing protein [Actinomycetospora lemnae]|uniref:DUF222 domain-containing protein n=1 Tax=Actinomycetospora lemnae TaxID=3019891 RepID=A0ABT5SVJ3_9PSEU|nr:HNH endonuclease signature motif containing protein [Actinomycetospora sp. DW7H6]MDD7966851.1 DUF222 domain-containing protein [Actinomycetospora sp. DW7H6]